MPPSKIINFFKCFKTDNASYQHICKQANLLHTENQFLKKQLNDKQWKAFEIWGSKIKHDQHVRDVRMQRELANKK